MSFFVSIDHARQLFPQFEFVGALTASEQKAAFHVRNQDKEDLCLKIVNPNFSLDRLPREVDAMRKLKHANVAEFVEYTLTVNNNRSLHYIIEKYIHGEDLSATLGIPWGLRQSAFFLRL
jgi:serine/threonine protein kinase